MLTQQSLTGTMLLCRFDSLTQRLFSVQRKKGASFRQGIKTYQPGSNGIAGNDFVVPSRRIRPSVIFAATSSNSLLSAAQLPYLMFNLRLLGGEASQ